VLFGIRVLVWVIFQGQLPIGALDFFLICLAVDAEHLVVILVIHQEGF